MDSDRDTPGRAGLTGHNGRMRRAILAPFAVAAFALGACTSSSPAPGPSSTSHPTGTSTSISTAQLTRTIDSALSSLTSVHLRLQTVLSGQRLTGSGDLRLSAGKVTAADVTQALPGGLGDVRVVIVGGQTYAQLPPVLRTGSAPWLRVSGTSGSATVRSLAAVVGSILDIVSPAGVVTLTRAATSTVSHGVSELDGVRVTHYSLSVDPGRLPKSSGLAGGRSPIPVELYVDAHGHLVRVQGRFTVLGQRIATTVDLSRFGAPTKITAPPADQVAG